MFNKDILKNFLAFLGVLASITTIILFCVEVPSEAKNVVGIGMVLLLILVYVGIFLWANRLKKIEVNIEETSVIITEGDIFKQKGFKAIAFNEYFDTKVDGKIIASKSLNGIFINRFFEQSVEPLDKHIEKYVFQEDEILEQNNNRSAGKRQKYKIGTICVYNEYLLTAFSKFNEKNEAWLTMPEYLTFLINFWDNVNTVYAQESVSVPVFGSGITRIKGHRCISDEDLLKIMLWTFKISETRFKYPAKLTIVIHGDKMKKVNLFEIKSIQNGI